MIDEPSIKLPSEEETEMWQFDLAKRIVRLGRDSSQSLLEQGQAALTSYLQEDERVPKSVDQ